MADARGDTEVSATTSPEDQGRPMPSPVSTLFAGLQAAHYSRTDFFLTRSGRKSDGYQSSSPSRSPEGDRLVKPKKRLPAAGLAPAAAATTLPPAGFEPRLRKGGLLGDGVCDELQVAQFSSLDVQAACGVTVSP